MRINITLFITLCFFSLSVAQNGINYKAIVKDANGNVVANTLVVVEFSILRGTTQNNVYKEMHTPITDANGLLILNIGEGTPVSGTFNTIAWANSTTFLNTKIKTGASFVDMGTTEFKSVPYAKNAETATVAANVTGLEALNEGNGRGWRLKSRNPRQYGNIGNEAVDLSVNNGNSETRGATGSVATAMGRETTASGNYSTAMGGYGNTNNQ